MNTKPDLSVIIVNYNTRELLRDCLKSVLNSDLGKYSLEVIVVDNASADSSPEMLKREFSGLRKLFNNNNLGFAGANNAAIKISRGRYILLLNSDTIVPAETLAGMLKFMDQHPRCGAATARINLADGTLDPACHRGIPSFWAAVSYYLGLERIFPQSRLFAGYHLGYLDLSRQHQVDCITGAFFLTRREVTDSVGILDEDFFMYGEDIDWCIRIKKSGWQIWFNPEYKITHFKKKSGRDNRDRAVRLKTEKYFYTYNKLLYKKHFGLFTYAAVAVILDIRYFFHRLFAR